MKIDGRALADEILTDLLTTVKKLRITPTLTVILVGDNPESLAYIRQKQKATEKIGGRFIFEHLPKATVARELAARIQMFDNDPSVHGLIIQRPLPPHLDPALMYQHMKITKDVDGFIPGSPFEVPIVMAIFTILESTHVNYKNKQIVVIGRGETAGKPIAAALIKRGVSPIVISSQTPNPTAIIKSADIIISCVGKERVITKDSVKPGALLLSVGLWHTPDGKIKGDYEDEEIKDVAGAYTPTPGGVGPLNVASLMQNLVKACMMK